MNSNTSQTKSAETSALNNPKAAGQQGQVDGDELGGDEGKKKVPGQQEQRDKEQQGGQQGSQKHQPDQGNKNEPGQTARR